MSRLTDKLKRITEESVAAIGFRSVARQNKPQGMLLVAMLDASDAGKANDLVESGADAVLLRNGNKDSVMKASKAARDQLFGLDVRGEWPLEPSSLKKAGYDFVVFDPESPASWVRDNELGRVLEVQPSVEAMNALRGADRVGVDVFFLQGNMSETVTVGFLMASHFLVDAMHKPVMVSVPAAITDDEVKALWDAGVDGIAIQADAGSVKKLRQIISELPPRARRKQGKETALLPRLTPAAAAHEEEEEDE